MYTIELSQSQLEFITAVVQNAQVVGQVGSTNLLSAIAALKDAKEITDKKK